PQRSTVCVRRRTVSPALGGVQADASRQRRGARAGGARPLLGTGPGRRGRRPITGSPLDERTAVRLAWRPWSFGGLGHGCRFRVAWVGWAGRGARGGARGTGGSGAAGRG